MFCAFTGDEILNGEFVFFFLNIVNVDVNIQTS